MDEKRMPMEEKIGIAAGVIWSILADEGKISVRKLKKIADIKERIFYMSLGWLAREDKLGFEQCRTGLLVELK